MQIVATGFNHRTAPIELRERFAVPDRRLGEALEKLRGHAGVEEAAILSTCNRVELYTLEETTSPGSPSGSASFFGEFFGVEEHAYINQLYRLFDDNAVRHLFRVASSLDSMIVGEPQILGQVKEAFIRAQVEGATGRVLNNMFSRALAVGKRVRTETGVGELAVSVPYAAVELAKQEFESLRGCSVALVGRGEMSELTARYLQRAGADPIVVVHRSKSHAMSFASRIGGVPRQFDDSLDFLIEPDIFIVSTDAPHHLVSMDAVRAVATQRGRGRTLLIIDISVPRAVDPAVGDVAGVKLFNVDHLETMIYDNREARQEEGHKAECIVENEVRSFVDWLASLDIVPTIRAFRDYLETVREAEIERWVKKFNGISPEQRKTLEQFSKALINKIGHRPTTKLKGVGDPDEALHQSDVLRHLFGLERGE